MAQLKYCQKLEFEGYLHNNLNYPNMFFFRFQNQLNFNIPGISTTLRFWGRLQNTSFLGTFDTFWGRFMQKRPFIFQAAGGYIHYALSSWIMWAFCVFPVWCWISHPYTAVRPRRMTKTACLNNFGSTVPVAIQNVCLLFKVSCRGKYVHIATLLQKIHRFENIGGLVLLVPTHCWNGFDWWTDGRVKKGALFQKKSFGSGRVQTGRIFPYFGRIFPYFRTPSGRPSAKKVLLKKKRPLYVCIVWADLPRQNVPSKLSNAPVCLQHSATECWDLPPCVQNERAKRGQKSKQGRWKPWHQYFDFSPLAPSISQNQNGTCKNELQVGNAACLFDFHNFRTTSMNKNHEYAKKST